MSGLGWLLGVPAALRNPDKMHGLDFTSCCWLLGVPAAIRKRACQGIACVRACQGIACVRACQGITCVRACRCMHAYVSECVLSCGLVVWSPLT